LQSVKKFLLEKVLTGLSHNLSRKSIGGVIS